MFYMQSLNSGLSGSNISFGYVLYVEPKFGVLLPQSHSSFKIFWHKIKKLLRNFEDSQGQFFKKLSGLDAEVVSYKKRVYLNNYLLISTQIKGKIPTKGIPNEKYLTDTNTFSTKARK